MGEDASQSESGPGLPTRDAGLPDCPRLDSRLAQLAQAADPAAFARSAGLRLVDGAVRVVVELYTPGGELAGDGQRYGLAVEARSANLLQARVPLDQLCPLAMDPAVLLVRPPAGFAPDTSLPSRVDGP